MRSRSPDVSDGTPGVTDRVKYIHTAYTRRHMHKLSIALESGLLNCDQNAIMGLLLVK